MNYEVSNFAKEVIERSDTLPVLVDFWAPWCGPCKVLSPVLERLAEKNKENWELVKVNTDVHEGLAKDYGVRGIPNVKLFVDGNVTNEFTGALPEAMVVQWLKKTLPSRYRKVIKQAEQLMHEEDERQAQDVLEEVLRKEPTNDHARVLLAGTHLYADPKKAVDLVSDVEEGTEHFQMAEAVRTIGGLLLKVQHPGMLADGLVKQTYLDGARELARKNYDAALEKFIDVVRMDREYDQDGARRACLAIFRTIGDDHEVAQKHRRSFSSALYM